MPADDRQGIVTQRPLPTHRRSWERPLSGERANEERGRISFRGEGIVSIHSAWSGRSQPVTEEAPGTVHFFASADPHSCVAFLSVGGSLTLRGEKPEHASGPGVKLATCLRGRRLKLGLSREMAAHEMDTPEATLRKWECGRTPHVAAYPKIIDFLGYEPWAKSDTLPAQIRAGRWRLGMTVEQAAKHLGVDPSTLWWWENGRKPHRVTDRERLAAFVGGSAAAPPVTGAQAEPLTAAVARPDMGTMLYARRKELGLTMEAVAELVGCDATTVLHWEHNHNFPMCRFFPTIIRFLGCEPWPQPQTPSEHLRAERLRRGLSSEQAAALLQVNRGSIEAWESGKGPRHGLAKAKIEAFLTGSVMPWRKRRGRWLVGP